MPNQSTSDLTFVERLNFLLTNRIPRRALTIWFGRFSQIRNPLLARCCIAIWRWLADDLRLHEARESHFDSLHDCFVRRLKADARPLDKDAALVSPCDAVVGAHGNIQDSLVIQAKGFPYSIAELLLDDALADRYANGKYITLRLKSSMYHHFHAPCDGSVNGDLVYISGDVWNVNPPTLKSVQKLFTRNERALLPFIAPQLGEEFLLVPVAAVLVASMRFTGLDETLDLQYAGPNRLPYRKDFQRGDHMGYFQHGSTLIVLTSARLEFTSNVQSGEIIRMGQPLMQSKPRVPN